MQKEWYVRQLKDRYPDIIFPFNNVEPGSKLDTFLAQNFPHHPMYLSPMDDQS